MTSPDRLLAACYDPLLSLAERGWLGRRRARLVRATEGTVVEIGAGTGGNLRHLTADDRVERWIATEPTAAMRRRLDERAREAAARTGRTIEVVAAPAESLPVPDGVADTVVSTLTLCTVRDPVLALAEIRRVLAPGGNLLVIEHVAADGSWRRVQRGIEPLWRRVAGGCHLTRDLGALLTDAGFTTDGLELLGDGPEGDGRRRGLMPMVAGRTRHDADV
ncbi:MAG: class I SAM-dependent methyltransferase [Nitriliruptoraceae bacterium]|nr:class I SAM-dependent methyltransferase [Nitriliruptoraceae bacterium]